VFPKWNFGRLVEALIGLATRDASGCGNKGASQRLKTAIKGGMWFSPMLSHSGLKLAGLFRDTETFRACLMKRRDARNVDESVSASKYV